MDPGLNGCLNDMPVAFIGEVTFNLDGFVAGNDAVAEVEPDLREKLINAFGPTVNRLLAQDPVSLAEDPF